MGPGINIVKCNPEISVNDIVINNHLKTIKIG